MPELRHIRFVPLTEGLGLVIPVDPRPPKPRAGIHLPPPPRLTKSQLRKLATKTLPDPRIWPENQDARYHVLATTGWPIQPEGKSGNHPPATSYTILDTSYQRIIELIEPSGGGRTSAWCRKQAVRKCNQLNDAETKWLQAGNE